MGWAKARRRAVILVVALGSIVIPAAVLYGRLWSTVNKKLRYGAYTLEKMLVIGDSARVRLAEVTLYVLLTRGLATAALDWTIQDRENPLLNFKKAGSLIRGGEKISHRMRLPGPWGRGAMDCRWRRGFRSHSIGRECRRFADCRLHSDWRSNASNTARRWRYHAWREPTLQRSLFPMSAYLWRCTDPKHGFRRGLPRRNSGPGT